MIANTDHLKMAYYLNWATAIVSFPVGKMENSKDMSYV